MVERYRVDGRRVRLLQAGERGDGPVVYWMNRDQRVADNWALLQAQDIAMIDERPLVVIFCLQEDYLQATGRHFRFMLAGLKEVADNLEDLNIAFTILVGEPGRVIPDFLQKQRAHSLFTDFNPLKIKKKWLAEVADEIAVPFYEVDSHNIVPCWHVSEKREYAAYTLRPKITRMLPEFLVAFPELQSHPHQFMQDLPVISWGTLLRNRQEEPSSFVHYPEPGERAGKKRLAAFVQSGLGSYDTLRNNPLEDGQSLLSPYFHFGQLAPHRAALAVEQAIAGAEHRKSYLEELIVRRELSDNFCNYCDDYDSFDGFPEWARKSLDQQRKDKRTHVYTEEEFATAKTHEPLWNCCQEMLVEEGRLHGYLRMYWAKKILEWSESPEEALRIGILLNDTFAFDGRDPNGYTGVAWSVGGVHDRAWPKRDVFGKVRFMNEKGCRRKFDVDGLVRRWQDRKYRMQESKGK